MDPTDPHPLDRFLKAQEGVHERALRELRGGRKRSHWMWYIFPQILGLGHSSTSVFYSIRGREEAAAYLAHPILGARLRECAQTVLELEGRTVSEIFGYPDDLKFRSSMTIFAAVAEPDSVFQRVLETYFDGAGDDATVRLLGRDQGCKAAQSRKFGACFERFGS